MKRTIALAFISFVIACASAPMTGKERAEYAESRGMAAERALDQADDALEAFEPDRAESLIGEAREALNDPDIAAYPEHSELKDRVGSAETKLAEVRAELVRREIERQVGLRKEKIEEALKELDASIAPLAKASVSRGEVEAAVKGVDAVRDAIADGEELAPKNADYAAYAKAVLAGLGKPRDAIEAAKKLVAFKEGALQKREEGFETAGRAKEEPELAKQRELYSAALASFKQCEIGAKTFLSSEPELAKRYVSLDGDAKATSADGLQKTCAAEAKSLDKVIAKIVTQEKAAAAKAAAAEKAAQKAAAAAAKPAKPAKAAAKKTKSKKKKK